MPKTIKSLLVLAFAPLLACGYAQNSQTAQNPRNTQVREQPAAQSATIQQDQATASATTTFKFNGATAWDYLVKQVAYGPRVPGTDAQIKCRDYIVQELKKGCDDVSTQHLTHHWSYNGKDLDMYNVIGMQNWNDAKVRVVLLAHWDSRPFSDGPNSIDNFETNSQDVHAYKYRPIPGADDGASGVAVMLELAKAIKNRHPGLGICYLFDDGEDLGPLEAEMLLGVDYFVGHMPTPKPDYGILLDMIGQKNLVVGMEQTSLQRAPRLTRAFYQYMGQVGLSATFPYQAGDYVWDDHVPFLDAGIPTLDLIEFNGYQAYWHTPQDTTDKCSEDSLAKVGDALEAFFTQNPPYNPK